MSRYIDADLLMQKWLFRGKSQAMYRDEIRSVPTADVVEVVRCEDCKHNDTAKCPSRLHDNGFFCAQGERREQMSRYIDADALKNKITELDGGCAIDGTGFDIYTCEVFELIDEVPTADVVEVVHGENISKGGFLCSVCKFGDFDGFHGYEPNFCPNCGAKLEVSE